MQLVLIGLFITVFGYDALGDASTPPLAVGWIATIIFGPKVLLAVSYALACRRTQRRLDTKLAHIAHRRLERLTMAYGLVLLPLFVLDVAIGGLTWVRGGIGDLILVDELTLMLPTLTMMMISWACYYPIDRALREAMILRHLDAGHPVYPVWSRGQFILAQLRHQVLLVLAPLALVFAWAEIVEQYATAGPGLFAVGNQPWLIAAGAGLVLLTTPLIIRYLWDTRPLAEGELRSRLMSMCQSYRVGVRELLLWRTFGGMANAAVMGLAPPVRYILLSDVLLDRASAREIEAVMAHELAHVKKRHMFWLLAAALGAAGAIEWALYAMLRWWQPNTIEPAGWRVLILAVPGLLLWAWVFGWVSRRAERQADTFAVQHLTRSSDEPLQDGHGRLLIGRDAVSAMVGALEQVARLNHIRPTRRNWRHGSIAWRQHYLKTLVGKPVDRMPIDRQMRVICLVALGMLAFVVWWALMR